MHSDVLLVIPARLGSTRLHEKALRIIGHKPMIQHVYERAREAGFSNIVVATDSELIRITIERIGGKVVMTDPELPSGTDRTFAAYQQLSLPNIKYIINLQGDMPFINPQSLVTLTEGLKNSQADITTLAARVDQAYASPESNVKIVTDNSGRALYFSRSLIPNGATEFLYHIGAYGFTTKALEKFISLPASYLEKTERLEQLRAMENGMQIQVCEVNSIPISVDTEEDLNKAINYYIEEFSITSSGSEA
ncbi:MAG: 3-deoxy-manno-octulosonate cytidylyltransferase [Rickettsiaceae bacterium]|jgi:3-deoxy-manno-octulosonate cytidylyltransferase (CMP-KDO synthetase)|nr:3-deoxy-manno-octulosonate cytidylyltransferase [Rickettsiaceae bacterium]